MPISSPFAPWFALITTISTLRDLRSSWAICKKQLRSKPGGPHGFGLGRSGTFDGGDLSDHIELSISNPSNQPPLLLNLWFIHSCLPTVHFIFSPLFLLALCLQFSHPCSAMRYLIHRARVSQKNTYTTHYYWKSTFVWGPKSIPL